MATDLTFGSVPPLYREVYEIVCPNQEHVDHDMFLNLLVKSSLPKSTLSQIWEAVDNRQGYLTRTGLYKALALTALAQQGKSINEKILEKYSDVELPRPTLGDLSDLKQLSIKVRREKTPNMLGYRFQELLDLDSVKVELVPEKKGLILKHVEYEVTSKRFHTTVLRRYNDFQAFQDTLMGRYPYRMIPRLPPKKLMGADRDFIEQRRRALRRFINLVVRHPVLSEDTIVKYFLTFSGSDMQHKIKEHFRGVPDEFMTNEMSLKAKDLVPIDTQQQFANSRTHMKLLVTSVSTMKDVAERMVDRQTAYAGDMLLIGKQLSGMGADTTNVSMWAAGSNDTWSHLKRGFKQLSVEYATLADKASGQAAREDCGLVEELNFFLDLLHSYRDLCDRHEKGVLNDHQRALQKMGQYKRKHMTASVGSETSAVDQLEKRILMQESEISNMENRNYFSLHCIQMETQLIHANLESLHSTIVHMANEEARGHADLGSVWEQMKPLIAQILPNNRHNGSMSPNVFHLRASPLSSPTGDGPPGITL